MCAMCVCVSRGVCDVCVCVYMCDVCVYVCVLDRLDSNFYTANISALPTSERQNLLHIQLAFVRINGDYFRLA